MLDRKQFIVLTCVIIFSAIILSLGIALQNGLYSCEKIIREGELLAWFRLNKFSGEMKVSVWNKYTERFVIPIVTLENAHLRISKIDEELKQLKDKKDFKSLMRIPDLEEERGELLDIK